MNLRPFLDSYAGNIPSVVTSEEYERLIIAIKLKFYLDTAELKRLFEVSERKIILGETPIGLGNTLQSFGFPSEDTPVLVFFFHSDACAVELPWSVAIARMHGWCDTDMWIAPRSLDWLIEVNHERYAKLFRRKV